MSLHARAGARWNESRGPNSSRIEEDRSSAYLSPVSMKWHVWIGALPMRAFPSCVFTVSLGRGAILIIWQPSSRVRDGASYVRTSSGAGAVAGCEIPMNTRSLNIAPT